MEQERRAVRVGVVVGMIGYASVALLYGVLDLVAGRGVFYTVDLLGKSVFRGLRDPAVLSLPMELDAMAIVGYSGLHLLVSLAIGLTVAGLVRRLDDQPAQAPIVLFTIVGGFVVTIVAVGLLTTPMRPVLPWWSIMVSNPLAVVAAGSYLLLKWPGTWERLSPFSG